MRQLLLLAAVAVSAQAFAQTAADTAPAAPAETLAGSEASSDAAPSVPTDTLPPASPDATTITPIAPTDSPVVPVTHEFVSGTSQYFDVLGGYSYIDKGHDATRHGYTGSLIYGYQFAPHLSLEVNAQGSILETGKNKGTDFYSEGGTIDAVYSLFDRRLSWTPYILAGVGGVYDDVVPDNKDKAAFLANAGLGVATGTLFGTGVKFRIEARYDHDFHDQFNHKGFNDYRGLAGVEIPFGYREAKVVEATEAPVQVREVIEEVPRPFIDSDGDGVDDEHDKCPDTPQGLKVDSDGCVIPNQKIELRGVTFEFNKAKLQLNAETVLDYVLKGMIGQPSMTVEIAGHTDSIGSVKYNQGLSQRRAEAVKDYLVSKGISASRLVAKGYGKSELLINPETNDTDRERNRRVEFRVTGK